MKYDTTDECQEILSGLTEDDNDLQNVMEEPTSIVWDGFLIVIGAFVIWWLV